MMSHDELFSTFSGARYLTSAHFSPCSEYCCCHKTSPRWLIPILIFFISDSTKWCHMEVQHGGRPSWIPMAVQKTAVLGPKINPPDIDSYPKLNPLTKKNPCLAFKLESTSRLHHVKRGITWLRDQTKLWCYVYSWRPAWPCWQPWGSAWRGPQPFLLELKISYFNTIQQKIREQISI